AGTLACPYKNPWSRRGDPTWSPVERFARWLRLIVPLVIGVILLFAWDGLRGQDTSLWALATANNDPGRLIRADELLPRLAVWLYDGGVLIGADGVTALLVGLALVAFTVRVWVGGFGCPDVRIDLILLGYIVAYGLLHWLVAFNQHDRYLLLLLPPVILLAARGMEWLTLTPILFSSVFRERHISESASRFPVGEGLRPSPTCRIFRRGVIKVLRPLYPGAGEAGLAPTDGIIQGARLCAPTACLFVGIILLLLAVLLPAAWDASEGRVRVGGDRGEHAGIDALADELNAKPLATVIYDHWLGWELGYYMGAWTDKRRVYYPTPAALVADALLLPESEPRYFPAPNTALVTPWLEALTAAGFDVSVDEQTERYTVYRLIPPVRRDS
ncbi:MAG: hypothetical protein K8I60_08060, partial [Anaerolineae bacterium]|nr:hypothetical protein [Anaerolineae bacterium]